MLVSKTPDPDEAEQQWFPDPDVWSGEAGTSTLPQESSAG